MADASILVRGGTILTQDEERRTLRGDVLVEGHRISAVGKVRKRARTTIDARGMLVMPGLVNAHTHAAMTLFRGLGDDLPLEEWLETRIWPAEEALTPPDVRAGADLAMAEMISSGTTAFNDMYHHEDEVAKAAEHAGVRCFAGFPVLDFPSGGLEPSEMPARARAFLDRWKGHDLVTPTVTPHATYSCGPATLDWCGKLAEEFDALIHTHCSETRKEVYDVEKRHGARPVEQLARHGCLTPRAVLAHCGYITKEEVKQIAAAGARVAHCPVSNLKLATGGTAPVPELLAAGVPVALGTDGPASNNTLDMFETMKFAALIHKHHRWDPTVLPAQTVLDMATRHGAACLGRDDLGSIEPGKTADLILVDASSPRMQPLHDPVSQIVYAARGTDVSAVIVAGKVLMRDASLTTVDAKRAARRAQVAATRLVR